MELESGVMVERIEDVLRSYVVSTCGMQVPPTDDDRLIERGFVTSLRLLDLVGFIEDSFAVELTSADVIPDNLISIGTIARMIRARCELPASEHGPAPIAPETIWSHRTETPYASPPWDELVRRRLMADRGPGQVALLGDAARVADRLDATFSEIAERAFGAMRHQYPTLLPIATLDRCHYFSSFPQHVTFALHVRDDVEAGIEEGGERDLLSQLARPECALSPAVCFHTYAMFADQTLDAPAIVTARGRCFRYESKNLAGLERSWDFTMREIIFLGERDWVEAMRQRGLAEVQRLIEQLGLDAWIETASDPFFASNVVAKRYHQLMTRAKFELRLALPYSGTSLAAASFNIHGDFFGRSFSMVHAGDHAFTGCIAFGVERWTWALFAQLGPDVRSWPEPVVVRLGL